MVLYNVTVGIDAELEKEWLLWMKQKHIPSVMNTGLFIKFQIYKVLSQEEEESISYSIQYFAENIEKVVDYLDNYAPAISREHHNKYKDRHIAFRTLLQEIV